jgi:hypothetical protein
LRNNLSKRSKRYIPPALHIGKIDDQPFSGIDNARQTRSLRPLYRDSFFSND